MQTETNRRMKGYMQHAVQWKERSKPGKTKYRGYVTQDS